MKRIPASQATRERLEALLGGKGEVDDVKGTMVREAVRLIVEGCECWRADEGLPA